MAENNGTMWTKGLVAGGGLAAGFLIGAVSVGIAYGNLEAHTQNKEIHRTNSAMTVQTRAVIDREVAPTLRQMQHQLDRIEAKLGRMDHE